MKRACGVSMKSDLWRSQHQKRPPLIFVQGGLLLWFCIRRRQAQPSGRCQGRCRRRDNSSGYFHNAIHRTNGGTRRFIRVAFAVDTNLFIDDIDFIAGRNCLNRTLADTNTAAAAIFENSISHFPLPSQLLPCFAPLPACLPRFLPALPPPQEPRPPNPAPARKACPGSVAFSFSPCFLCTALLPHSGQLCGLPVPKGTDQV